MSSEIVPDVDGASDDSFSVDTDTVKEDSNMEINDEIVPDVDGASEDSFSAASEDSFSAASDNSKEDSDMEINDEIVPDVDGASEDSFSAASDTIKEDSIDDDVDGASEDSLSASSENHWDSNGDSNRALDSMGFHAFGNPTSKVDLIGQNHHTSHFLSPEKGHKYVTQFDPSPESLNPLIDSIKEPSMLLLRGCDLLLRPSSKFPFIKFKTLTALEISNITHLSDLASTLPGNVIPEMNQLQTLTLTHLPIQNFPDDFFSKLTNLRSLSLTGCSNILSFPKLPQMDALESLDLSYLPIKALPEDCFVNAPQLRWIILRGCSKLRRLPSTNQNLEVLDLSHCTSLRKVQDMEISSEKLRMLDLSFLALPCLPALDQYNKLTHLFLRDVNVTDWKSFSVGENLEVLDLSGAQNVTQASFLKNCHKLVALDLSRTSIKSIATFRSKKRLRSLILRDCVMLVKLPAMEHQTCIELFDISGCEILVDFPKMSDLINIKEINLSGCSRIVKLNLFDQMPRLEKLDLSKTRITHLPSLANFTNLGSLNISHTPLEELPEFCTPISLREFFFENCHNLKDVPASLQALSNPPETTPSCRLVQGRISKPSEFHLVSTFFNSSGFDRFKQGFKSLVGLISKIQKSPNPATTAIINDSDSDGDGDGDGDSDSDDSSECSAILPDVEVDPNPFDDGNISVTNSEASSCATYADFTATNAMHCKVSSQTFSRQSKSMIDDLEYIKKNIDPLESSPNSTTAGELLNALMNASDNFSPPNFPPDSPNLNELFRMIVKLKLLVPRPKEANASKNDDKGKEKFARSEDNGLADLIHDGAYISPDEKRRLNDSYKSLTDNQRNCLLYFSVFPFEKVRTGISERILIQLWYGEGFIQVENVALSNQTLVLDPAASSDPNPEPHSTTNKEENPNTIQEIGRKIMLALNPAASSNPNPEPHSTTNEEVNPNTIQEIGRKILLALNHKGFVQNRDLLDGGPYFWCMKSPEHCLVEKRAKASRLFYVNSKKSKRTPHFCLLKSSSAAKLSDKGKSSSTFKISRNYSGSSAEVKSFKAMHTLLNINDPILDIRPEWISKMRNLSVLHLGSWDPENVNHIEVVDWKFLEELKNMRRLRLLSLERFSTIKKLPDSVCELTNLRMLNLRQCGYLEELPDGIGSLVNLTHLDLTDCNVLLRLPKELSLLSKLEVLKGFVITYQIGGKQIGDACTLGELLKLEKLRKLNLVVNTEKFPDSTDLQVFKEMESLCNLQIRWELSYDREKEPVQKAVRQSKTAKFWEHMKSWQQLKCWGKRTRRNGSSHLDNLKKLKLYCLPLETAPEWLHPSELQKLEKLYIVGGDLKALVGGTNEDTSWKVKNLKLRYLCKMEMEWDELRRIFSKLTYFTKCECGGILNCPTHLREGGDKTEYWVGNNTDAFWITSP